MPGSIEDFYRKITTDVGDIKRKLSVIETLEYTQGGGTTDHGSLSGLGDDDHTQYALLAGRATGQWLKGGTAASDSLVLESTNHPTKGPVRIQPNGGNVGINNNDPNAALDVDGDVIVSGTLFGGAGSGDDLTLKGSAHATSGGVVVDDDLIAEGRLTSRFDPDTDLEGMLELVDTGLTASNVLTYWRDVTRVFRIRQGVEAGLVEFLEAGRYKFVGDQVPLAIFERQVTGTTGTWFANRIQVTTTGDAADTFGTAIIFSIGDNTVESSDIALIQSERDGADNSGNIRIRPRNAGTNIVGTAFKPNGNVGINTIVPQARLHAALEAGGGFATKSVSGVAGTAVALLPAGSVTAGVTVTFLVVASNGLTTGGTAWRPVNTETAIFNAGGVDVLMLRVTASGAVDVRRTAGSMTYAVAVSIVWI